MCLSHGSIEWYKTQYVAQGFSQEYGLDYDEMFSLVVKIIVVQVPPAIVVNKNWKFWQMNMKNVFSYVELDQEIYMNQPNGWGWSH